MFTTVGTTCKIIYCIMHYDIIFGKRTGCCYQIFHLLFLHLSSVYTSFVLPPTVYHASVIFFLCIFWLPFSHLLLLSFKLIFTLVSMVFDLKCLSFFFSITIIYIAIVYPVVHHWTNYHLNGTLNFKIMLTYF